jgi:lauroyl/myristoyl acyltransferase
MHILVRGKSTLRQAVRLLRSGRILAILPDLRKPTPGLTVAFLGGAANMADGMAVLARLAHAPIVPCYVLRAGWLRHRVHLLPLVRPDPSADGAADAERMTRAVMAGFDAVIRKHPAQWFWYNKRWVLDPLVNS